TESNTLGEVLAEAYLSSRPELQENEELMKNVIHRLCMTDGYRGHTLYRFPVAIVVSIANDSIGLTNSSHVSAAFFWLIESAELIDWQVVEERLLHKQNRTSVQLTELWYLLHAKAPL